MDEPENPMGQAIDNALSANRPIWDELLIDAAVSTVAMRGAERLARGCLAKFQSAILQEAALRPDSQLIRVWATIANDVTAIRRVLCTNDHKSFRIFRRAAPLDVLLDDAEREEVVRATVLGSPLAEEYRERWSATQSPPGWADEMATAVITAMGDTGLQRFRRFVQASGATKWLIAADFVIGADDRANDVFAISVIPYDDDLPSIMSEIEKASAGQDLKKTRDLTKPMVSYLRSPRRFHFGFVANRGRHKHIVPDVAAARKVLDTEIARMRAWRDASAQTATISAFTALRRRADANNFNVKLFSDMILLAVLMGTVGTLLHLDGRAEIVGFFPDRDKMTEAYDGIALRELTIVDMSSFVDRRRLPHARTTIGVQGENANGALWFDSLVRIPDFVAGALAATRLDLEKTVSQKEKHARLIREVFADNDNLLVMRVDLNASSHVSRIVLSSTPLAEAPQTLR
jgi:hypothetical protein